MAHFEKITPEDTKQGHCEKFWEMLWEAALRAEVELPFRKSHRPSKGKEGEYAPFDGVYLPDANSFWCGIIHAPKYRDLIVFSPEGANIAKYQFDETKAGLVRGDNYEITLPAEGLYIPKHPRKHEEYKNVVVFKSDLGSPFVHRPSFYSLECGDCQCEWLSVFIRKACRDVKEFYQP